ncbi:SMP-30/gluconolactonase/LRE family protein [Sulfitobacter sp. D35]|uniref:SMP-30/gluconolactonase/LRE family protein n=1 Tax=Sulfitobacter sp. D35 TaxID=3083252 RepID=UPI00296E425D|nr:SMP-30/gluconolactonase/LRE family protein [Sulfitobacter sp. D35]MDW4496948.1 SMP-30/gluconolactonase/LRE family protein [Sulfitobacter sp. D35]
MTANIFDDRPCALGEGPLWHPEREQFFWFDILGKRLLSRTDDGPLEWQFDEMFSAAGWVDRDTMILASQTALWRFSIGTGATEKIVALEAGNAATRSNDGRADPYGGFWIGTMGLNAEPGLGAIYRYYRGELRKIFDDITVSNAISFPPGRGTACFADTRTRQVMRVALDSDGWPSGTPDVFIDTQDEELNPDGAVFDEQGNFWVAQWGSARVACYDAQGNFVRSVEVDARHSSCPAFGGPDLGDLYVTSARQGISKDVLEDEPSNGMTFRVAGVATGQKEHRVIL